MKRTIVAIALAAASARSAGSRRATGCPGFTRVPTSTRRSTILPATSSGFGVSLMSLPGIAADSILVWT